MVTARRLLPLSLIAGLLACTVYAKGPSTYNFGPTGLIGSVSEATGKITAVAKGSPAEGKLKAGDTIVGANGKTFKGNFRKELAEAINESETEKSGGRLSLILKGNKTVDLQLQVLGSYSATAPYKCAKTDAIITQAAESLMKPRKGGDRLHPGLLGLMATGEKKYIDYAAGQIEGAEWAHPDAAKLNAVVNGEADAGYVGWQWGYNLITLSEYYLLTGDKSVLPGIKAYAMALSKGQDAGGLWGHRMISPKRNFRLPGYAQINQPSLTCYMGLVLADKCGVKDPVITKAIDKTYGYFSTFVDKGCLPYGVHGPNSRGFNNNGTSGSAAIGMSIKGDQKAAAFFSRMAATSYDGLESGHASTFFNPLWTPLGVGLSGPETTQQFSQKMLWLQTMYRSWDGSFSRFGGGSKEGPQAGSALLAYCLPRRVLYITGKNSDESIWLSKKAATAIINMSKIDYKSQNTDAIMKLATDHPFPQVRRQATAELGARRDVLEPTFQKWLKSGTATEKKLAVFQYGWWIKPEVKMPVMDMIGALLQDESEDPEVRQAAAGSLAYMGEEAHKYYMDMVKILAADRPDDPLGNVDAGMGKNIVQLCKDPFARGLVTDKDTFYKAALKLVKHKRQGARASGLQMLADMPLEDFHLVANDVMHVIDDKDPTYHSYHNPGGPVTAAISILAHLNIREGIDLAMDIEKNPSGKGSFKMKATWAVLGQYGANAKDALKAYRERSDNRTDYGRHTGAFNKMVKAIEEDTKPKKLISLQDAINAGK